MKLTENQFVGFLMGMTILVIASFIGVTNHYENKRDAKYQAEIKACQDLDPKYATKTYMVKEGPYSEVEMIATDFGHTWVGLVTKYGKDDTLRKFLCSDVKEVEGMELFK